jgi:phospholipid/cholesterol/gamma-HCH transport system permease protein
MESSVAEIDQAPLKPAAPQGTPARLTREAGDLALFGLRALAELRGVWRYAAEVLRQVSILVSGTAVFLAALMIVHGSLCAVFGNYFLRSAGATDFVGLFTSQCEVRGGVPLMFGYVFAAKVGCGFVAEIGAMRISEELDAYDAIGIDPVRYVVATRLLAAMLFIPVAWGVAIAAHALGTWLGAVKYVGEVSQGAFERVHWGLIGVQDLVLCLSIVAVIGTSIALVATYYGYRVRGGPEQVGTAVARSMVVNLVLVHVIYGAMASIYWGGDIDLPIGG